MNFAAFSAELGSALRHLRRTPRFAALAIGLLAAGVGAVTLVYSVVNGILLRPLPFARPAELVGFQAVNLGKSIVQPAMSAADFRDLRQRVTSLESFGAYRPDFATWRRPGEQPVQLTVALVTEDFFATLGVAPRLGRVFSRAEFSVSAPRGAVLSHEAWQRRFAGDPAVVGRTITLNDQPCTILGVMPPTLREPAFVDAWLPFPAEASEYFARDSRYWIAIGRLKGDTTAAQVQAEAEAIATDLARQFPDTNRNWTLRAQPLHALRVAGLRSGLLLLLAATGLLLVVACSNLANLLLARGLRRMGEMAVRQALGASGGRLLGQVLLENALLGLAGGGLGVAGAFAVVKLVVNRLPPYLVPRAHEVNVDGRVLLVALGVSVIAGMLAGVLPAWQAARCAIGAALKENSARTGASVGLRRLQRGLVVVQVALTFVVLAGALLLGRSLAKLQAVDPGFRPTNVLLLYAAPAPSQYESQLDLARYFERLVDAVRMVPGIEAAAVDASAPLGGVTLRFPYTIVGEPRENGAGNEAVYNPVTDGFFATLGLRPLAGRLFTPSDDELGQPVVIVNEALACRLAPDGRALGKRLRLVPWLSRSEHEVVGIVRDVRQENLSDAPPPQFYVPQRQATWFFSTLLVRVREGVPPPLAALRDALTKADPGLATEFRMLEDSIAATSLSARMASRLFAVLGGLAFALTLFGVYANLAFAVAQRTREFGLRLALGATPANVVAHMAGEAARLVAAGLALGGAGAWALGGALRNQIVGVGTHDPLLLGGVGVALASAALVAAAWPTWRAASIPPATALRHS
ncbi:MAG: ADOP family duplicated permease [Opitutaceae bacterium]